MRDRSPVSDELEVVRGSGADSLLQHACDAPALRARRNDVSMSVLLRSCEPDVDTTKLP
jgi:hypothetical protein